MGAKELTRLEYIRGAVSELLGGLNGTPFRWGDAERSSKEPILSKMGFVLVSKSKLERGGHELKRNAKPVGQAYFGAPLKVWADLYLLDVQTHRVLKWYDLWDKGKALLEHQWGAREEYGHKPLAFPIDTGDRKKEIEGFASRGILRITNKYAFNPFAIQIVYLEYLGGGACYKFQVWKDGERLYMSEKEYGSAAAASSGAFQYVQEELEVPA